MTLQRFRKDVIFDKKVKLSKDATEPEEAVRLGQMSEFGNKNLQQVTEKGAKTNVYTEFGKGVRLGLTSYRSFDDEIEEGVLIKTDIGRSEYNMFAFEFSIRFRGNIGLINLHVSGYNDTSSSGGSIKNIKSFADYSEGIEGVKLFFKDEKLHLHVGINDENKSTIGVVSAKLYSKRGKDILEISSSGIPSGIEDEEEVNPIIGGDNYVLPHADKDTLGGVKIGSGVYVDSEGRLNAEEYIAIDLTKSRYNKNDLDGETEWGDLDLLKLPAGLYSVNMSEENVGNPDFDIKNGITLSEEVSIDDGLSAVIFYDIKYSRSNPEGNLDKQIIEATLRRSGDNHTPRRWIKTAYGDHFSKWVELTIFPATSRIIGGVKVGRGLYMDSEFRLNSEENIAIDLSEVSYDKNEYDGETEWEDLDLLTLPAGLYAVNVDKNGIGNPDYDIKNGITLASEVMLDDSKAVFVFYDIKYSRSHPDGVLDKQVIEATLRMGDSDSTPRRWIKTKRADTFSKWVEITNILPVHIYNNLPSNPIIGQQAIVGDAKSPVWNEPVENGGSSLVNVFWSGTDWICG